MPRSTTVTRFSPANVRRRQAAVSGDGSTQMTLEAPCANADRVNMPRFAPQSSTTLPGRTPSRVPYRFAAISTSIMRTRCGAIPIWRPKVAQRRAPQLHTAVQPHQSGSAYRQERPHHAEVRAVRNAPETQAKRTTTEEAEQPGTRPAPGCPCPKSNHVLHLAIPEQFTA